MSGTTIIGKDKLKEVLNANEKVLGVANNLVALAREHPELKSRLLLAIDNLIESGMFVNTAMGSISGGVTGRERR